MAGEYLPPVVTRLTGDIDDLIAKIDEAKAAMSSLKSMSGTIPINFEVNTASLARARTYARQLQAALPNDTVKINFDVNTASLAGALAAEKAMTAATNNTTGAQRRWLQWLGIAHNILTVFGANIIADTIGIVAFGVGAVAALGPVVEAFTGLGATYGYLSPLQQQATVGLTNFVDQFERANQSGIFAVFSGLLDLVDAHIGKTGGIMQQAAIGFENFVAMLRQAFASAPWQALFTRDSGVIQKDLTALFTLLTALINIIPALFHDFNGLGLFVLSAATAILHLIAIIGNSNPALMRFAAMVFLVYRALSMLGQFKAGSILMTGLSKIGLTAISVTGAFQNFQRFGLLPTISMMTGLSAFALGAVGGVLALGAAIYYGNFVMKQTPTVIGGIVSGLTAQDQAVGNNVAGYERLTAQLGAYVSGSKQLSAADKVAAATGYARTQAIMELNSAYQQAQQRTQTLRANLQYLEQTYGLSQREAIQLAQATGTNLTQAFNKGGGAAQMTRLKIQQYEQAVQAAANPTSVLAYDLGRAANTALQLDDRVTALTNAFNALLTPFANVIQDTVTWKNDQAALEKAVDASNGKIGYNTALQRASAGALATSITDTINLSEAILQQTGSLQRSLAPIQQEINYLEGLRSKSAITAQAIATLQQYINALKSKTITITTIMQTIHQNGNSAPTKPGYATGTGSASPGWHWVGEFGPELEYFRGGETVVPHGQAAKATGGYAGGTGDGSFTAEAPIVIMLDGKPIYKAVQKVTYYKNTQNNVRNKHGSVQGRMGTR